MNKSIVVKLAAAAAVFALAGCQDLKPLQADIDSLKTQVGALQTDIGCPQGRLGPTATCRRQGRL